MKAFLSLIAVFVIVLLFSTMPSSKSQTDYHSIKASGLFDLDPLRIKADYDLNFRINAPSEIIAGNSATVVLSPTNSKVATTIMMGRDQMGPFTNNVVYGQRHEVGIPGGYGIALFIESNAFTNPYVTGPGQISSSLVPIDSMVSKEFNVSVDELIGNYDSITIHFPLILETEVGANLNLLVINEKLASDTFPLKTYPALSVTIPIKKYHDTNLSLQVIDGSSPGYIKVKPTLTYEYGRTLSSDSIAIYVDGSYKQTVNTNSWTELWTGSGSHRIEGRFSEEHDYNNNAIIYKSSSDSTSFNVKSPPKQSSQPIASQLSKSELTCGKGTHEENGQCVADIGGCLIATATFGSEMAPQVQFLREIRDNTVMSTQSGASFMTAFNAFYYSFSPTVADLERQNPAFKEAVKATITPLLSSLVLLNYVDIDTEEEMLGYGIGIILLNIGMYFIAPAFLVIKLRSSFKKQA